MTVLPVAEARAGLSRILADFRHNDQAQVVVMGSHRKPEAALLPYAAYERLSGAHRPPTLKRLRKLRPVIERLATASRVTNVRIFGSVARGEASASSDVDVLVTPLAGATLFDLAQFELDLELILECPVTVVSSGALDPASDFRILADAVAL